MNDVYGIEDAYARALAVRFCAGALDARAFECLERSGN